MPLDAEMPEQVAQFGPNLWQVARGCGLPFQCDDAPADTIVENIAIPDTLWSDMPAVHVGAEWQPVSVDEVRDDICQEHRPVPLLLPPRHLRQWAARAAPRHSPWKQDQDSVFTEYAPEVSGEPGDVADVDAEVQKEVPVKVLHAKEAERDFDSIMTESSEITLNHTPRKEILGLSFSKCEFKRIKERAPEVVVPEPILDDAMLADAQTEAQAEAESRTKALIDHAGDDLPQLFPHSDTLWDDSWSVADEDLIVESSSNAMERKPSGVGSPLAASAVASSAAASAAPVLTASDYTIPTKAFKTPSLLTPMSPGTECEADRTDESLGASESGRHAGNSEAASDDFSFVDVDELDREVQIALPPATLPNPLPKQEVANAAGQLPPQIDLCQSKLDFILKATGGRFPQAPSCVVELLGGHPRPLTLERPAHTALDANELTLEQREAMRSLERALRQAGIQC